jgi:NADPH-dependent 2,4-dienoyl-CoA reductase/sulfur reductase-like enzyme
MVRDRIVVVGASLAGLRTAEALRAHGFTGELTIVGDELQPPYDRPPLSKELLAGSIEADACHLPYEPELAATWRLGRRAVALDLADRRVTLDDASTLPYDGLVIATGSAARPWPAGRHAHLVRSLDDSLALREACRDASSALIIGAGFIGCEVAATLRSSGRDVTLLDIAPRPMMPLGPLAGEICARMHRQRGVHLRMAATVAAVDGRSVQLTDGERLEADVLVAALGAIPNTGWLDGSGLRLRDGVVTDRFCFADDERRIVAAGDVAVFPHPLAETPVAIRHWSNAIDQAPVAAANLLANDPSELISYEPVPSFWSDQYDVKIQSVGFPHLADTAPEIDGSSDELRFVAAALRDGRLVGAVGFNRAGKIARYRRLLADEMAETATAST